MCLPNPENITIYGNSEVVDFQQLTVRLVKCKNRTTCKSDDEIDEFIDKNGNFMFIQNKNFYYRENYTDDVV